MSRQESLFWQHSTEAWGILLVLTLIKAVHVMQGNLAGDLYSVGETVVSITAFYWLLAGVLSLVALKRLRALGLIDDLGQEDFHLSCIFCVPMGMLALLYTLDQMTERHILDA